MEKSSTIKEIANALAKFQSIVEPVKKKGTNPFFKSSYATLDDVLETVRDPLQKSGLSFSQFPSGENSLTTILMHTSGEFLQSTVKMTPKDDTPQGQGSAITYMRRYALSAVLGIATEVDDDGNKATGNTNKTIPQKTATKGVQDVEGEPFPSSVNKSQPRSISAKIPKSVSDKTKIAHLLGVLKFDTQFSSPEDIRAEILKLTGIESQEENYSEIVSRLEVIVKENEESIKNSQE